MNSLELRIKINNIFSDITWLRFPILENYFLWRLLDGLLMVNMVLRTAT